MPLRLGIPLTAMLLLLSSVLSSSGGLNLYYVLVGVSAAWIAFDSWRIEITEYQTQLALPPAALFVVTVIVWPLMFPLYLRTRHRIGRGTIPRGPHNTNVRNVLVAAAMILVVVVGLGWWAFRSTREVRATLWPVVQGLAAEFGTSISLTIPERGSPVVTLASEAAPDSLQEDLAFRVAEYMHQHYRPQPKSVTVRFVDVQRRGAMTVTVERRRFKYTYMSSHYVAPPTDTTAGINGG